MKNKDTQLLEEAYKIVALNEKKEDYHGYLPYLKSKPKKIKLGPVAELLSKKTGMPVELVLADLNQALDDYDYLGDYGDEVIDFVNPSNTWDKLAGTSYEKLLDTVSSKTMRAYEKAVEDFWNMQDAYRSDKQWKKENPNSSDNDEDDEVAEAPQPASQPKKTNVTQRPKKTNVTQTVDPVAQAIQNMKAQGKSQTEIANYLSSMLLKYS